MPVLQLDMYLRRIFLTDLSSAAPAMHGLLEGVGTCVHLTTVQRWVHAGDVKAEEKKSEVVEQHDSHVAQTNATFGQRGRGVAQSVLLRANGLELGGSQDATTQDLTEVCV
jgi:hypothetical protein